MVTESRGQKPDCGATTLLCSQQYVLCNANGALMVHDQLNSTSELSRALVPAFVALYLRDTELTRTFPRSGQTRHCMFSDPSSGPRVLGMRLTCGIPLRILLLFGSQAVGKARGYANLSCSGTQVCGCFTRSVSQASIQTGAFLIHQSCARQQLLHHVCKNHVLRHVNH